MHIFCIYFATLLLADEEKVLGFQFVLKPKKAPFHLPHQDQYSALFCLAYFSQYTQVKISYLYDYI